jgi:hypothetical protein
MHYIVASDVAPAERTVVARAARRGAERQSGMQRARRRKRDLIKIICGSRGMRPDPRRKVSAPSATRTRDLLLRRT